MSLYQIKNNNLEPIKKVNFKYEKDLQKLTEQGLITINSDRIQLTNKGLDLANLVWEEFV